MARLDRMDLPGTPGTARFSELVAYFLLEEEEEERRRANNSGATAPNAAPKPFGSGK